MSELFETAIIEKRNVLNEIRASNLTLQELRFFSIYLSKINPRDENTRSVKFPFADFKKIMDFGKLNIQQLKNSADSILGKKVFIPLESGGFEGIVLFDKCKVDKNSNGEWFVEISASNAAMPLMFDFKERYFRYELWNALRLRSPNQIRMYEILKQYEKLGKRELSVKDLRELLGISDTEYSSRTGWSDFKKGVLDSCQKALKEITDISYTYERGKTGAGGKWLTIIFHISKNVPVNTQMTLFESEIAEYIDLKKVKGNDSEENAERLSPELQNMILFADDLTKNDVKEIYYAMQEKSYENIFLSFKRLYQTAVNNDPANLKAYILGIIRNEKI
ncbi:replication initiation protein [Ruminococcus sp.]|jgi:plasmid replication initiation protein|uniref:replication initiation protein n=1 Tax=Ruminococcus sp. TaxID=41978 RepID=UPI0025DDCB9B|nr:replication initiation protein [Ruminococcus sp.]